jgi:16S rRNA (cytosine967-C5)-methyltransferase
MKYFHAHFKSAEHLLSTYSYPEPFHIYLKRFFKSNKKFGKKDRESISDIVYTLLRFQSIQDEIQLQETLNFVKNSYSIHDSEIINHRTSKKLSQAIPQKNWPKLSVDLHEWEQKIRIQPFTFIQAIHPEIVKQKLEKNSIPFAQYSTHTIVLDPKTPLHQFLLPQEYYIQDYSCQLAVNMIDTTHIDTVWDACAASGGKSLGLLSKKSSLNIFATDIRESILKNYQERLSLYGYDKISTRAIDLTQVGESRNFDLVWADVPCSGSGTWGRNPEHLIYFHPEQANEFVEKQSLILHNCWSSVKKNGVLVYTTCSVFLIENEDQVSKFIESHPDSELITSEIISGNTFNSDYMYIATIKKNN